MTEMTIGGFQPTAEQIAAQQARRAAQLAEKAAKKGSKFGGKTIFDKNTGLFKEINAQQVKTEYLNKSAVTNTTGLFSKMKGVASKAWSGIKSIPSKIASKFKSGASTSANSGSKLAGAKNWIKGMGGKIQNGLKAAPSKVGRFFKSKGGKWALVGLAVAAATAAGVGIYKAVKGNSEAKTQEPEGADKTNKSEKPTTQTKPAEEAAQTEEPPEEDIVDDEEPTDEPAKTDKKSSSKKTGSTTGAAAAATTGSAEEPDKTDKADKAETTSPSATTGTDEETPDVPTVHKVVKGDNVWNIAKKHLQEINGKKPTNAEILKHTKELMEINGLEFEPDGKRVLIRPNDELKLIA